MSFIDDLAKLATTGANDVGSFIGNLKLGPPGVGVNTQITPKQVAKTVNPNSALTNILSGKVQNVPQAIKQTTDTMSTNFQNNPLASIIGAVDPGIGAASPVRINLKPSVYGAGREAAVQQTVDNLVPGATATQKYASLQPTMDSLGNKITQIMQQNPKAASLDQVMSDYDKNLQSEGVYRTASTTKSAIQETAQKYLNDLQSEASGQDAVLNPTQISDTSLQKIKQQVNQDAQSIFKKIDNGTTLTDKDRVILSARQTLDDTITSLHPEIKDLTTQQSHLYDAADSLYKGRENEITAANKAAATPQSNALGGVLGAIGHHPLLSLGALTAGGSTAALGGYALSQATSVPKDYKFSSGNVTLPALNQITDSTGSPLGVNVSNYVNGIKSINDQEKPLQVGLALGIPSAKATYGQLELQRNNLETQYGAAKPLYDQYVETSNQIQGLDQAQQLLKKANPSWFTAFGPLGSQFRGIRSAIVPGYASFEQSLNNLHEQFGIDVSAIKSAASPEAADAAINQTVKSYQSKLQNTIKNAGGQWPSDEPKQMTGKDILQSQLNQINTGSQKLNDILTPTPTDEPSPTPNGFQQLLQAPFQPS